MPRRASRVDANHASVVAAARKLGFLVLDLSGVGRGCPDLLLHHRRRGLWALVEVKAPKGKVNALQADFGALWPVSVVRTVDELLTLIKKPPFGG